MLKNALLFFNRPRQSPILCFVSLFFVLLRRRHCCCCVMKCVWLSASLHACKVCETERERWADGVNGDAHTAHVRIAGRIETNSMEIEHSHSQATNALSRLHIDFDTVQLQNKFMVFYCVRWRFIVDRRTVNVCASNAILLIDFGCKFLLRCSVSLHLSLPPFPASFHQKSLLFSWFSDSNESDGTNKKIAKTIVRRPFCAHTYAKCHYSLPLHSISF